jgi:hypothetical protein
MAVAKTVMSQVFSPLFHPAIYDNIPDIFSGYRHQPDV